MLLKPLQVIGIIVMAGFSFIVQEPSGIMVSVSVMSFYASLCTYRIIFVSENFMSNWGCYRNLVFLLSDSGKVSYVNFS